MNQSFVKAQTNAMTQPISVHPKKKFSAPMAGAFFFLSLAIKYGIMYMRNPIPTTRIARPVSEKRRTISITSVIACVQLRCCKFINLFYRQTKPPINSEEHSFGILSSLHILKRMLSGMLKKTNTSSSHFCPSSSKFWTWLISSLSFETWIKYLHTDKLHSLGAVWQKLSRSTCVMLTAFKSRSKQFTFFEGITGWLSSGIEGSFSRFIITHAMRKTAKTLPIPIRYASMGVFFIYSNTFFLIQYTIQNPTRKLILKTLYSVYAKAIKQINVVRHNHKCSAKKLLNITRGFFGVLFISSYILQKSYIKASEKCHG